MRYSRFIPLIFSVLCITLVLSGCSVNDTDENYGEAYDVEYLTTDYVDQLMRDGAETTVGTIEIAGNEDNYTVTVDEKKIVSNENYEDGYYIADKNITNTYPLGSDLGILTRDGDEIIACSAEDFIRDHSGDTDTLYTVYLIGGEVELVQPLDPKTAAAQ